MLKKKATEIIILIAIILSCFAIFIYYKTFHSFGISQSTANWSNFGEYLTGAIGTILSFFTIILIYKTYKNQVNNSINQQFETTFFSLLQNQREILKSMKGYIEIDPVVSESKEKKAEDYIDTIAMLINKSFDGTPGYFVNEQGEETWKFEDKQKTYERINKSYNRIYKGKEAELGHYFRHLYHIFKYISESEIHNKKKYIDIIQAQMDDNELYVSFYNGISEYGKKRFLPMLNEYNFFENIRSRGIMFDRHKKLFYPQTKFKYNSTNTS